MKLPAFQFYPGDWMKDPDLRRCSHAAKGVWIDLICLMHETDERGVLISNGVPWKRDEIAMAVGGDIEATLRGVDELTLKGVLKARVDGAFYCARIVRDEAKRQVCREAGKRGGNPNLKPTLKGQVKGAPRVGVKPKPTPSSSSSLSSSDIIFPPSPSGEGGGNGEQADQRHHAITSQWGELYRATFGHAYAFNGRDASALKRFLGSCKDDADTILKVARDAWVRTSQDRFAGRCKEAATIHGLCNAYNDIRVQLAAPTNNGAVKTGSWQPSEPGGY